VALWKKLRSENTTSSEIISLISFLNVKIKIKFSDFAAGDGNKKCNIFRENPGKILRGNPGKFCLEKPGRVGD
jgi:hypothetical protein